MTAGWRIEKESEGWAEASAAGFGLAWCLPVNVPLSRDSIPRSRYGESICSLQQLHLLHLCR
jgi:hypothetical protein